MWMKLQRLSEMSQKKKIEWNMETKHCKCQILGLRIQSSDYQAVGGQMRPDEFQDRLQIDTLLGKLSVH